MLLGAAQNTHVHFISLVCSGCFAGARTVHYLMQFPYFSRAEYFFLSWRKSEEVHSFTSLRSSDVSVSLFFLLRGHILLQRGRWLTSVMRTTWKDSLLIKARRAFNWIAFFASFVWCVLHQRKTDTNYDILLRQQKYDALVSQNQFQAHLLMQRLFYRIRVYWLIRV